MDEVMKQYAMKLARYAAVVIGAWLVKRGFPDGASPDFIEILSGLIVLGVPLVVSFLRTKLFVKKAETQALLTHALAAELVPVQTSRRAGAIMNKLVADTASCMPPSGTSDAKVNAAIAGAKP